MGDGNEPSQASPESDAPGDLTPIERVRQNWRSVWQIPTLVAAGGLLISGVVFAFATTPRPDLVPALDRADHLIAHGDSEKALDVLKEAQLHKYMADEDLPSSIRQRYHLAVARAVYRAQIELGLNLEENHKNVVSNYLAAEREGAYLGSDDLFNLADTYLSLKEYTTARVRADEISASGADRRVELQKRLVDAWLALPKPRYDEAMDLLASMLADPGLGSEEHAWALNRQTKIRLAQGYADEAITRLLRAMPRLEGVSPGSLGELHLLLGRAYVEVGAWEEAERQLETAEKLISSGDALQGDAIYHLALIDVERNNLQRARERLGEMIDRYPDSAFLARGYLLLGETDSALGDTDTSKEAYSHLVEMLATSTPREGPTKDEASESLLDRAKELLDAGDPENALAFATLAKGMFTLSDAPADVLATLALAHERNARQLLGDGENAPTDPSTRAEAQRHLISAATYYRMHADKFILTDNDQYARSLWAAADLYDQAGDTQEAVDAFRAYAEGVPGTGKNAEARYRLGRAFQAMRDYSTAASYFRELIDEQKKGVGADVGPFADRSYVPLAQVLLADEDKANDAEAEQLLRQVVGGSMGDARTPQYREALLALGDLLYKTERYERAIELFEEARARYPDVDGVNLIRFRLADAYRLSARSLEQTLAGQAMPDSRRREMERLVRERRQAAIAGFEQVRAGLEGKDPRQRTPLEKVYLRNSYFYLGDLAFEMGDYQEAIRQYDRARERYPEDPASLVAMVQIVNAHLESGDIARARTANERALRFFNSLPDEVWDDPTLPMGRKEWEEWLEATSRLYAGGEATTE
ncbi:MAG: tetratricopeptide repeat protein [Phycisphaerales bacterium]